VDTTENCLIAMLSRRDRLRLLAACDWVDLKFGEALCEPNQPLLHVYFPVEGFLSLQTTAHGAGVGVVGREGMLGAQLILGVGVKPLHAEVLGSGRARRADAEQFRHLAAHCNTLERTVNRYVCVRMADLAGSVACAHSHNVDTRLASWLLMIRDRAHSDTFHVTQELLSDLLAVRRVSVTTAAGELQRRGLISYSRGAITLLNRVGMESAACACYLAERDTYNRTFA
jgi:CRP-like cAMP-binding protein